MGRRRTRYSSTLAEDWVVSPAGTEKVAPVGISANRQPTREISSPGPAHSNQGLNTTQGRSAVDDDKKRARYKKSLPSDWIASDSEDDPVIESSNLQPLRGLRSSTPSNTQSYDAGIGPMPTHTQPINRSNTPARIIHTSIPPQKDGEFVPPPAPVEDRKMYIGYQKSTRDQQGQSTLEDDSFLNSRSRAGQTSSTGMGPSQPFRDSTVSPPISVGQSSTDSPSYGRDLPAIAPAWSPSYSNC